MESVFITASHGFTLCWLLLEGKILFSFSLRYTLSLSALHRITQFSVSGQRANPTLNLLLVLNASFPLSQQTDPTCPRSELPEQTQTVEAHGWHGGTRIPFHRQPKLHLNPVKQKPAPGIFYDTSLAVLCDPRVPPDTQEEAVRRGWLLLLPSEKIQHVHFAVMILWLEAGTKLTVVMQRAIRRHSQSPHTVKTAHGRK